MSRTERIIHGLVPAIALAGVYGAVALLTHDPNAPHYGLMALLALAMAPIFIALWLWYGRTPESRMSPGARQRLRKIIPKKLRRPDNERDNLSTAPGSSTDTKSERHL